MDFQFVTQAQVERRKYWIDEIIQLSGQFSADATKLEEELSEEITANGVDSLLGHLRLCSAIPEKYGHDSSEEKLYSKYTDVVIHEAFVWIGLQSIVLTERAGVADVECVCDAFSFVADAKAFRLSRTAKNQKDFKIQAMDTWKRGRSYAMMVSPVYQLPSRTSQIYEQAAARSVCIATYTHLAVLVRYAQDASRAQAVQLLHSIFKTVEAMNPSRDAVSYWQAVNRVFLESDKLVSEIWADEKCAASESIRISKQEALAFLSSERERIMKLPKDEAIRELLSCRKVDKRIRAVSNVADNGILRLES